MSDIKKPNIVNWSEIPDRNNVMVDTHYGQIFAFQDDDGTVFNAELGDEIKEFTVLSRRDVASNVIIRKVLFKPEPVNQDGDEPPQGKFDYINWDVVPEHNNVLVECNLGRVYAVQNTNGTCLDGLTGAELKEYRILARRPGTVLPDLMAPHEKITGEWQSFTDDTDLSAITSQDILTEAGEIQVNRGVVYDAPSGERSMGKTVAMFNIHTGFNLTEEQGWQFMELLKMVRSGQSDFKLDNYVDGTSYASLAGESAARDRGNNL